MGWVIEGKTVLITGGARGMGAVTAMDLARDGAARIILVDWEGEEGTRTRDAVNTACGRDVAEFYYCDLSSQGQVRTLADYVNQNCAALHVLINNAGITDSIRRVSEEGVDMHVATNHFSHHLLSHRLLPLMRASAPARIIIISSDAHKSGKGVDFDDLNMEKLWGGKVDNGYAGFQAYHRTKLCNIFMMQGLAERLAKDDITVNAVSPGYFVNTTIYRNTHGLLGVGARMVFGMLGALGINTPEKGARSHIYLAKSDEVSGVTGKYFEHIREKPMGPLADDAGMRRAVWEWTIKATGEGSFDG